MNDSSAPQHSLDDLLEKVKQYTSSTYVVNSDTVTISNNGNTSGTISSIDLNTIDNITLGTTIPSNYYYTAPSTLGTISIGSGLTSASIAGLNTINTSQFNIQLPEEWVDRFPEWDRIKDMCEQYPGLKIAFDKFKTTYLLVKGHYDTPEDERPRP